MKVGSVSAEILQRHHDTYDHNHELEDNAEMGQWLAEPAWYVSSGITSNAQPFDTPHHLRYADENTETE